MHRICFLTGLLLLTVSAGIGFAQLPGTVSLVNQGGGGIVCTPNTQGGGTDANVVGLWHFENSGADTSPNLNPTLTLSGTANYFTTQKKFGNYSLGIGATGGSYAGFPNWAMALTGDFTMEAWMYFPGPLSTYFGWFGDENSTTLGPWGGSGTALGLQVGSTSANSTATLTSVYTPNTWAHFAFERTQTGGGNGIARIFVNGVEVAGSPVASAAIGGTAGGGTATWQIGRGYSSYQNPANSFIDEVRISNMARYTANFSGSLPTTPFCDPSSPYTGPLDIAGGANAWWGLRAASKSAVMTAQPIVNLRRASDNATCDVIGDYNTGRFGTTRNCSAVANNNLLWSTFCSSQCYATKLYDQSGNKLCTGTVACDAAQATAANQPRLDQLCLGGLSCLTYTAGAQTLTTPTGPSVAQPFSVSGLALRNGTYTALNTFYVQGTTQTQFRFAAVANTVGTYNGGPSTPTAAAADNTAHSMTGAFSGSSAAISVDGTTTPGAIETTGSSGVINIGPGTSGNALSGSVTEMGLWPRDLVASTESAALCNNRYAAAYGAGTACGVPPTACTPNTQGGGTDQNVKALWHFDNNLNDTSGNLHNGSGFGSGGSLSTAQSKFGGYSALFTSTASQLTIPSTNDFAFGGGDFTWEWWGYSTNPAAAYWGAFGNYSAGTTGDESTTTTTLLNINNSGATSSWPITRATPWTHFAYVRQGGNTGFFLNGILQSPGWIANAAAIPGPTVWYIGNFGAASSYFWNGYIDEMRVSNMARYTANFTPQFTAFCDVANVGNVGTPTLFAQSGQLTATGTTFTTTTTAPIVAGNLAVLGIGVNSGTATTITSVSDGVNTYQQAMHQAGATTNYVDVWYKQNAAAVSSGATITVTLSGTPGTTPYQHIIGTQASGISTTFALDAASGANASTAASNVNNLPALTYAPELMVCYNRITAATAGSNLATQAVGFTNLYTGLLTGTQNQGISFDYRKAPNVGAITYNPIWSTTNGALNQSACATFRDNQNLGAASAYRYYRYLSTASQGPQGTPQTTYLAEITLNVHGINQLPAMTGPAAPPPFSASSPQEYSGYETWHAANRNPGDWFFATIIATPSTPVWLNFDLGPGNAQAIDSYSLQTQNTYNNYNFTAWTLMGSNDNSIWVPIDQRSGFITWPLSDIKTFTTSFANASPGWHPLLSGLNLPSTNNLTGYQVRTNYGVPVFAQGTQNGTQLRVTFYSNGTPATISGAFIGHSATTGARDMNFDGTQTQIKCGGSNTCNVPATGNLVSDPVNYSFNAAKDLLVSIGYSSGGTVSYGTAQGPNLGSNYGSGNANAGNTTAGFSATSGNSQGPVAVEVYW